jgi:hypothetical protein
VDVDDSNCPDVFLICQWTARDKIAVPKQSNITIRATDSFLAIAIAYFLCLT